MLQMNFSSGCMIINNDPAQLKSNTAHIKLIDEQVSRSLKKVKNIPFALYTKKKYMTH